DVELTARAPVRVQKDLSVGEHAIDVEEQQLDPRGFLTNGQLRFQLIHQRSCTCTTAHPRSSPGAPPPTPLSAATNTIGVLFRRPISFRASPAGAAGEIDTESRVI